MTLENAQKAEWLLREIKNLKIGIKFVPSILKCERISAKIYGHYTIPEKRERKTIDISIGNSQFLRQAMELQKQEWETQLIQLEKELSEL